MRRITRPSERRLRAICALTIGLTLCLLLVPHRLPGRSGPGSEHRSHDGRGSGAGAALAIKF
jgi:hypothetical protein